MVAGGAASVLGVLAGAGMTGREYSAAAGHGQCGVVGQLLQ